MAAGVAAVWSLCGAIAAAQPAAASPNLALGRPYTLAPRPNYALTTDADDDRQLTDGVYTPWDPMWLRPTTVGWLSAMPVTITIDLERVQPIAGVSFSTAAGRAGVQWPRSIFVLVSDDNAHFYPAGDLTQFSAGVSPPLSTTSTAYRFARTDLRTHGRYVTLIVEPTGPFLFCDEIEIRAGDQALLDGVRSGEMTANLQDYFIAARQRTSVLRRHTIDLEAARIALAGSNVDAALRAALAAELNDIEAALPLVSIAPPEEFVALLPMGDLHRRILAVQGRIAEAEGWPALSLWAVNPWDFVRMLDKPPGDALREVSIAAMNGETRSAALSLANSTGQPMTLSLRISGEGDTAADLQLFDVTWTDTRELIPVADALIPLASTDPVIELPAGMTRQIWIRFSPRRRDAGSHQVFIDATADDGTSLRATVALQVFAGQFPERPALHVGGWDYTDSGGPLHLSAEASSSFIETLRGLGVDSPWATAGVMPFGTFDAAGHLDRPPDTSRFDSWIAAWPGASRYFVFLNVGDAIGPVRTTDVPRFTTAVGEWITFWTTHAASLGVLPPQLSLLLVDEPSTSAQDARIGAWGRAIHAAQPSVAIWEDPIVRDPSAAPLQLLDVSDDIALERSLMDQLGAPFVDFYRGRAQAGQRLAVYGASGSSRLVDPYTYYRLQAWVCAAIGANASFFWSFSDDAKGRSWNEYAATRTTYSPLFISPSGITLTRHAEAMREGMEDFEYLSLLRGRLALPAAGTPSETTAQAADVLQTAAADVLRNAGPGNTSWAALTDRTEAERVRRRIGALLESLSERPPDRVRIAIEGGVSVYDGAPHRATAVASDANGASVPGSLTIEYAPGADEPPVHAGTYVVTAKFSSADARFLDGSATAALTIEPATPLVTVGGHATYDALEHSATAAVTGIRGLEVPGRITLTYSPGGAVVPSDGGVYGVVAGFVSDDPDYRDASATGSFTIDSPPAIPDPAVPPVLVAALTNPPDGATSVDLSVRLRWTTVDRPAAYRLYLGSSRGAKDLVNTGKIRRTSYHVANLPPGKRVYARLWTKVHGTWRYSDSTFRTASRPRKVQTAETPSRSNFRPDRMGLSHRFSASIVDALHCETWVTDLLDG